MNRERNVLPDEKAGYPGASSSSPPCPSSLSVIPHTPKPEPINKLIILVESGKEGIADMGFEPCHYHILFDLYDNLY